VIILEWTLEGNRVGRCWMDSSGPDQRPVAGLVNTVMNLRVPQKAGNFLTSWVTVSFSWRTLIREVIYLLTLGIGGCIQKFPDWPPGARTTNGTALCH
jgi:hypothetical protein